MNLFMVFVGGGIGALARYWMQGLIYRLAGSTFPYGTLLVNLLGSFIIGLLLIGFQERHLVAPSVRIFVAIGILGGFTTFSSFSFETVVLFQEGELLYAFLNVGVTVTTCLAATYAGVLLGRIL